MKFIVPFIFLFSALSASTSQMERVFTKIYKENTWCAMPETVSGNGSTIGKTNNIRKALPELFSEYNIKSILDLPCGDFNWMKEIDLDGIAYHGGDIVAPLIISNQKKYTTENITFSHIDATSNPLKQYDLIICRDLFLHLSNDNIKKVLANLKQSKSKYFLISTAPGANNPDHSIGCNGHGRSIDLENPIYNMGKPILLIYDDYANRHMGLWKNDTL